MGFRARVALGPFFQVRTLSLRSHIRLSGPEDMVEPRPRDAPVRVLIGTHMVVVVPRQMHARPSGILVSSLVASVVVVGRKISSEREVRGQGQERRDQERQAEETQNLFALCVPFEWRSLVVGIVEPLASRIPVMLVPMKGPERALPGSQSVEHVLVGNPFDGVRKDDGHRNAHQLEQARTR